MLIVLIASLTIAAALLRALALPRTAESVVVAALAGYCVLGAALLVIGSYSLTAAAAVLLLAAVGGTALGAHWAYTNKTLVPVRVPGRPRTAIDAIGVAALALSLVAGFVSGRAPVTSWDAGVAHLALPAAYERAGRIEAVPGNNYAAYPQLVHTLFAAAPGALETSANGIAWSFGVLMCASVACLAVRVGGGACGYAAPAIVATTPLFLEQSSVPGIDVPYTATVVGALCALAAWRQEGRAGWLVLAGLLAGSGCGIRHTAYLANALLVVGVALLSREGRVRHTLAFAAVAVAAAAPWLVRTALVSGNPVYPFFSSVLGGADVPDVDVAAVGAHSSIQGRGLLQLVAFPWSLTMHPAQYGGWSTSPGALWLVLGTIGIAIGGRGAWALGAFSGTGVAAMFFFQRFARYAFPFLAPMMALAALPYAKLPRLRGPIAAALLASYGIGLAPALAHTAMKLPAVCGTETRESYLARRIERYPAMAWAAKTLPKDAVVLSLDPRGYYFERAAYTNFEALKRIAGSGAEAQRAWLEDARIGYLFYPAKYVQDSPAFRETGVGAMVDAWRADPAHFALIQQFDLPCPRDGGTERVEIYAFRPR